MVSFSMTNFVLSIPQRVFLVGSGIVFCQFLRIFLAIFVDSVILKKYSQMHLYKF